MALAPSPINNGAPARTFFPTPESSARRRKPPASAEATLEPVVSKLERFVLYETLSHMYLVGCDKMQSQYRVLKIDRGIPEPAGLADICQEDPVVYSPRDVLEMLEMIHEGNRTVGGVRRVTAGYGIVGFVKFLDCYYLNLITQRRKVGAIGGNIVYAVKATDLFAIRPAGAPGSGGSGGGGGGSISAPTTSSRQQQNVWSQVNRRLQSGPKDADDERRYRDIYTFVDLSKDFFFSYTYDLTHTLQHNMTAATAKTFPPPPFKDMYAWNFSQTRELEALVGHLNASFWVQPVVHGAFLQRRCGIFGRAINLTLVARRSRHFAGTRYLKRGVSDCGKAANDVEVEQIVHAEAAKEGVFSSFVQMRGSSPTFWTQETHVTMPKPPIVLSKVDPTYAATQAHFADLLERYSSPVVVLDLVKQTEKREREVIVGKDYRRAIEHINSSMPQEHKVRYFALDFSHLSKGRDSIGVLKALDDVAQCAILQNGFFCSSPVRPLKPPAVMSSELALRGGPSAAGGVTAASAPATEAAISASVGSGPPSAADSPARSWLGGFAPSPSSFAIAPAAAGDKSSAPGRAAPRNGKKRGSGGDLRAIDLGSGDDPAAAAAGRGGSLIGGPTGAFGGSRSTPVAAAAAALALQGRGGVMPMEQRGVLRTNCIDSVDRTNVAQFSVGVCSLGRQLYVMGVNSAPALESGSQVVMVLMEMYSGLGDHVALQYGGSEAHKKVSGSAGPSKQAGSRNRHKELLTSIRRYYSNAFRDRLKQDSMNLFLGFFVPSESDVPLWELDGDYYLHNTHVTSAPLQSMREYKKEQYYPDQEDELVFEEEGMDADGEVVAAAGGGNTSGQGGAPAAGNPTAVAAGASPAAAATTSSGQRGVRDLTILTAGPGAAGGDNAASGAGFAAANGAASAGGANSSTNVLTVVTGGAGAGPITLSGMIDGDRLAQIQSRKRVVRRMCARQRVAMAQWWREALQRYAQKRMWMHLGPPKQGQLPQRFVRVHKPYKLTWFDKLFSHSFNKPTSVVRDLSHVSAGEMLVAGSPPGHGQQGDGGHGGGGPVHGQVAVVRQEVYSSGRPPRPVHYATLAPVSQDGSLSADKSITISRYVRELSVRARSMLGRLGPPSDHHDVPGGVGSMDAGDLGRQEALWGLRGVARPRGATLAGLQGPFVQGLQELGGASSDWGAYEGLAERPAAAWEALEPPGRREEFEHYLRDVTVDTESPDMVAEVARLAREGHCTATVELGPYRGLPQDTSARTVAAAVFEQLEQLSHAAAHGLDVHEEMELLRQGLVDAAIDVDGVREQIEHRFEDLVAARAEAEAILDPDDLECVCSTFTDDAALELYCSFFEASDILRPDFCYMQGLGGAPSVGGERGSSGADGAAAAAGVVAADTEDAREAFDVRFVRLEDDLYACRDNQYMLFNEVAALSAIAAA